MTHAIKVEKARKDYPEHGIKKGEPYWWWKFRFGGKHFSKTPPRRSQLTQSAFYATLWDIEDDVAELAPDEGLEARIAEVAQALRDLGEECQSSFDNMPEGLQEGDTGQMLQERIDACEAAADELESIDCDISNKDEDQTDEEFWEDVLEAVQAVSVDAP